MLEKIIFSFQKRSSLRPLLDEALEYAKNVPDQAEAFHKCCSRLTDDIGKNLTRFWVFWVRPQEKAEYTHRVKNIKAMSDELPLLINDVSTHEKNVLNFLEDIETEENFHVRNFFKEKSLFWQRKLHKIGRDCERTEHIYDDNSKLSEIKGKVSELKKNLRNIRKGRKLLKTIGKNVDSAPVENLLKTIVEDIQKDETGMGALQGLFDRLSEEIDKLGKVEGEYRKGNERVFADVENIGILLDDLSGWATIFKDGKRDVEELDREYDGLVELPDKKRHEVDFAKIHENAQGLKNKFIEKATRDLKEKLASLEEKIGIFKENIGSVGKVFTENFETCKNQRVERHQDYKKWERDFKSSQTSFFNISGAKLYLFDSGCAAQKEKLIKIIGPIREKPMREGLKKEVEDFLQAIEQRVFDSHHLDAFFKEFEFLKKEEEKAHNLGHRAREEIATLNDRVNVLLARNKILRHESLSLEVPEENLEKEITTIKSKSTEQNKLETSLNAVSALEKKMFQLEKNFSEGCNKLILKLEKEIKAAGDILSEIDSEGFQKITNMPSEELTVHEPAEARKLVGKKQNIWKNIHNKIDEEIELLLEKRLPVQLKSLQSLKNASLSSTDHQKIERLLGEFENKKWVHENDKTKKLKIILGVKNDAEMVLSRLLRAEKEVKKRLKKLKSLYNDFNENHFDQYCPDEFIDRLNALIEGVPKELQDGRVVTRQVVEAETLFKRLKQHALRMQADEVEKNMSSFLSSGRHAKSKKEGALKKELEKHEFFLPLPFTLRRKLEIAVNRDQ